MTEPTDELPDLDPLTREAIAWVVRLRSGEVTTDDSAALQRWRAQSAAHEEAFRRAARLWRNYSRIAAEDRSDDDETRRAIAGINPVVARRALLGGGVALAAAAAGFAVVYPPFGLWPSLQELTADYRTGKGQRREIKLGRDVSLELSTLTSITVGTTTTGPHIELISGEAAIDAATPLVVIAADGRIRASHATFDARCIDGAVSVTCVTGAVDVERAAAGTGAAPPDAAPAAPLDPP